MKAKHVVASLGVIGVGIIFVKYCGDVLLRGKLPLSVVGYLAIATGILGLLGVNVFIGGPLDKRKDQD